MMELYIEKTREMDTSILKVSGEIDAYTAPQLKDELLPLIKESDSKVLVDLSDVNYIDSTGLGVFIGALKTANEKGSSYKLVGLQKRVKRLFSITGLDEVIDIDEEKREEAK